MNQKIIFMVVIFGLVTFIPIVYGQLSIGVEAKQESTEIKIGHNGEINVKHVIKPTSMQATLPLFAGGISNLIITNEIGEEVNSGIADDGRGNQSILVMPSEQNTIVEYDLEKMELNNNLFSKEFSYPQKFSVIFDDSINLIFLNNNNLFLDGKKGIAVNGGGSAEIKFYSNEVKIIEEVVWEENKFDVEIITDYKIEEFNFDQEAKSISFKINNEGQFVTIIMSEELLGGPYVTLLEDEQILHSKYFRENSIVSLNLKPETPGKITIIGTTVIPEFSMFIPLIMGFIIILTVPTMRKFSLR
jgi:hypothetical protein